MPKTAADVDESAAEAGPSSSVRRAAFAPPVIFWTDFRNAKFTFSVAFVFGSVLNKTESEIAKSNW
jgi:hypothetical protein